jgi:exo-beta-1,3-glucanase (GH17 family)
MEWAEKENILTFFFEAFDETWKGSPEPLEPEKHWGLFKIDRTPKMAVRQLFEK